MSILMGKEGRLVLPKKLREKYKVKEGDRFIVREYWDQIILIPVAQYRHPTQELHGSVELKTPIDEPKELASGFLRKKLRKEFDI
jgi:AbrB family looped-hinge helix DNA binding protein